MRKRLANEAPELHASLERSWQIALDQWLPAIATQQDSFNSYPHLRNLEAHLDQVVTEFEAIPPSVNGLRLRPVELYLILAAVLFHDFGRVQKDLPHPLASYEAIERDFASLGIPTAQLARVLANICLAHDPPPGWSNSQLYNLIVEPYGEIRQRPLAALLTLVDHMDGAHNRALPHYVKETARLDPIGRFRRMILGVHAEREAQIVRVVLSDMGRRFEDYSRNIPEVRTPERVAYSLPADLTQKKLGPKEDKALAPWLSVEGADWQVKKTRVRKMLESLIDDATKNEKIKPDDLLWTAARNLIDNLLADKGGLDKFIQIAHETVNLPVTAKNKNQVVDPLLSECIDGARTHKTFSTLIGSLIKETIPTSSQMKGVWEWLEDTTVGIQGEVSAPSTIVEAKLLQCLDNSQPNPLFRHFSELDWLVSFGLIWAKVIDPPKQSQEHAYDAGQIGNPWPSPAILAAILSDVKTNAACLETIRSDLASLGIPLRGWLIEHREHIYNVLGFETFEPTLDKKFLHRVADGMWQLSRSIFGCARYTYEELASHVWEPDVAKTKRAVRRIAIAVRDQRHAPGWPEFLCVGDTIWGWEHRMNLAFRVDDWSGAFADVLKQFKRVRAATKAGRLKFYFDAVWSAMSAPGGFVPEGDILEILGNESACSKILSRALNAGEAECHLTAEDRVRRDELLGTQIMERGKAPPLQREHFTGTFRETVERMKIVTQESATAPLKEHLKTALQKLKDVTTAADTETNCWQTLISALNTEQPDNEHAELNQLLGLGSGSNPSLKRGEFPDNFLSIVEKLRSAVNGETSDSVKRHIQDILCELEHKHPKFEQQIKILLNERDCWNRLLIAFEDADKTLSLNAIGRVERDGVLGSTLMSAVRPTYSNNGDLRLDALLGAFTKKNTSKELKNYFRTTLTLALAQIIKPQCHTSQIRRTIKLCGKVGSNGVGWPAFIQFLDSSPARSQLTPDDLSVCNFVLGRSDAQFKEDLISTLLRMKRAMSALARRDSICEAVFNRLPEQMQAFLKEDGGDTEVRNDEWCRHVFVKSLNESMIAAENPCEWRSGAELLFGSEPLDKSQEAVGEIAPTKDGGSDRRSALRAVKGAIESLMNPRVLIVHG